MDEEERNYCCLVLLLSRVGLEKLRQLFKTQWNALGEFSPWTDHPQNGADLLTKFTPLRYERPKVQSGDTKTWDLSLLVKALLYSRPPFVPTVVGNSEATLVTGLKCLKDTRDVLCHTGSGRIASSEFKRLYSDACDALVLLGASWNDLLKVKKDVEKSESVISMVKDCSSQDEDIIQGLAAINQRLDELQQKIEQNQQQTQETLQVVIQGQSDLKEGQDKIVKGIKNLHRLSTSNSLDMSSEDVEEYSIKLKEAITKQTDLLPKGPDQSRLRTDDIFTNLTVYHGKQKSLQERAQKDKRFSKKATKIEQCEEIFADHDNSEDDPKAILVFGEPGIGKTLFSQKIVRDWSTNCISIPNIKFTYLITFRQLVLLGNTELTLRELLNRSSLLNERTMIDEALIEYIIQHPEELFVVLDGFDEYKEQSKSVIGDFESQFSNDVSKMPVAALVSKLIRKKILSNSVIMITSRPNEAFELDEKLHFDRYVQITGFSEAQIIQYVEKYFNSKPKEVKKMAIEKVKGTAHFMSFGRVPLRCFLMCPVIEYEIQNKLTRDNSVHLTLTQFYYEVIVCIERNNREISRLLDKTTASSAVEKTLNNFATLVAKLVEENRFTFTLKDLEDLKLPEDEMSYLKSSSLIFCYPVAIDSPFPQTTLEYGFAHFTIQEFFVAWHLVKMDAMVAQEATDMVYTFTSGLLGLDKKKTNEKLMVEVLDCARKQVKGESNSRRRPVLLRCLHEFGQEKEFTRQELTTNPDYRYWRNDGWIELRGVTDTDCGAIAMLIDSTATSTSSPPYTLYIGGMSSLTSSGISTLMPSLTKRDCNITELRLVGCQLDNTCAQCLSQYLADTKLIKLNLVGNNITDTGVNHIVNHLPCTLTWLDLVVNPVSDECRKNTELLCEKRYPSLKLGL